MKAAYINETGPAENIIVGELPVPEISGSQVLVKVAAAAVNPVDTYVRAGKLKFDLPRPFIVGCDLAGVVEAIGPEAKRFQPGDRVWGTNQGLLGRQGTLAEFAAVDECWLYPTPPRVSDDTVAACSLVGITAHLGLVRDAQLQPNETLFVNGGTGGVGSMVIQMARTIGARVIATGGSDEKVADCRELGADLAINYKTEDVAARVREFAPEGVNVWWETISEPNFDQAIGLLTDRGRMVIMAGRDARPPFPVGPFYTKNCRVYGFVMFKATPDEQRAAAEEINRWLMEGKLHARIDRVMRLDEAAAAHKLQEENTLSQAGTLAGKIVIKP